MLWEAQDYSVQPLEIGFASGQDRLLLWLPMTMTHVIDETSPLSNWKIPEDALQDADATIVILVCKHVMVYILVLSVFQMVLSKVCLPYKNDVFV